MEELQEPRQFGCHKIAQDGLHELTLHYVCSGSYNYMLGQSLFMSCLMKEEWFLDITKSVLILDQGLRLQYFYRPGHLFSKRLMYICLNNTSFQYKETYIQIVSVTQKQWQTF